jgi:endonuclease YncB( thermonuclease family)
MMRRLAVALLVAFPLAGQPLPQAVDGDTFRLDGQAIRIVGLDAPEMHARCEAEYLGAVRARARLAELLQGGVVITRRGTDLYGRTLAIVRDLEGRDVAQVMIAEGLARSYDGRTRRQTWCDE